MGKRVLFLSDGIFTPSGFGTVAKNIIETLCTSPEDNDLVMGHLSYQFVGNKLNYYPREWKNPLIIYPIGKHRFGKDVIIDCLNDFEPDIILSLGDLWMCNYLANDDIQKYLKEKNIKWYWYIPIDSNTVPRMFIEDLGKVDILIAMSKDGQRALKKSGLESIYIPHGVNTSIYYPMPERKVELKKKMNQENSFIIGHFDWTLFYGK